MELTKPMTNRERVWQFMLAYYHQHKELPTPTIIHRETGIDADAVWKACRWLKEHQYIRTRVDKKGYVLLRPK